MKCYYSNTKTGSAWICRARVDEGSVLSDVYGRFSERKQRAFQWCFDQWLSDFKKGRALERMRICSHNTFGFSISWKAYRIDPRTKRKTPAWIIHTPSNEYWVFEV